MTQTGVKPDITKIKAILDYPPPTSKQDVQRFLGMTNFIAKFLPQLSDVTAPLRELVRKNIAFHSSVREGFVPSIWKAANITPVQKSSPPIDVDSDFRPISLTPIISKILESFPYKWLLDSVSKKIDSLQFGSLKGSSTSMALIYMLHKWFEAADKQGNTIRICLLDFSKAFDRLDHNILLEKLKDMEVHPVLLNWIANFLTGRQQRTRVGQFFSEWKFLNAGVPQGTKLGPLLFLIMINDLAVVDETVKFVDDTSLWEIISNNSPSQLPANIISCSEWSSDNNMKLKRIKDQRIACLLF